MSDLISIIVPVYNTSKYLNVCINSILNQNHENIELILVDDGSTDCSGSICDEFAKRDKRIIAIHKENEGQGIARNVALDIAKGDYIGFVDSDDYILPEMFADLYEALKKHDADMSFCSVINDHIIKKKECPKMSKERVYTTEELFVSYLREPYVRGILCNKLYKAKVFQGMRFSAIRAREDAELIYQLLGRCNKAVYVPKSLYVQLIRPGSTEQSSFNKDKLYTITIFRNMTEYICCKFPQISVYTELLEAEACGNALAAIVSDKNYRSLHSTYEKILSQLEVELESHKNHDAVNDELFERLQKIVNSQPGFVRAGKKMRWKKKFLDNVKRAAICLLYKEHR